MYHVGIVLKPQGIKGEIKVQPLAPRPERFFDLETVYIKLKELQTFTIASVSIRQGFVFLKLHEVNSRNDAEQLRDKNILVSNDHIIDLDPDEYFIHDLVGCKVYAESGQRIGEVIDVMQNTSNDIYVVTGESKQEYLIPAIKDVIKQVDIKEKQIIIHVLDGLLE
jgi:16S rRNA processing protein RimM